MFEFVIELLDFFLRLLALCDVRTDGNVLPWLSILSYERDDGRIYPVD